MAMIDSALVEAVIAAATGAADMALAMQAAGLQKITGKSN